jgi:hypothetical protein
MGGNQTRAVFYSRKRDLESAGGAASRFEWGMAGSGDAVTGVKSGAYSGLLASLRCHERRYSPAASGALTTRGSEADCRYDISYPRTSPDSRG